MLDLQKIDGVLTMGSREIAQIIGYEHETVEVNIKYMLEMMGIDAANFIYTNKDTLETEYRLPKRECLITLTGYTIRSRIKIIDKWQELEDKFTNERLNELERQQARLEGKVARRVETDTIKEFVEYATKQGSSNAKMYYANITKGTYEALYILEQGGSCKELRQKLSTMQLNQLATAETIAMKAIDEHMDIGTHYKDIYKIAIAKVIGLSNLLGKQPPGGDIFKNAILR